MSPIHVTVISEMNWCFDSNIHEYSPYDQIHVPNPHRIVCWSSVDFFDHVDVIRVRDIVWRYDKEVIQVRFFVALTFLEFWRYGFCCSFCKWFPTSFISLSNRLVIPRLRFRIISFFSNLFFLMRQISLLLFLESVKVHPFNLTWDVEDAPNDFASRFILLPGFPEAPDIPRFSMQSDLIRQRNSSQENKKMCSSLLVATWTHPFLLLFVPEFFLPS